MARFLFGANGPRVSAAGPSWGCCRCCGALYIGFIALLVAVPIGLFAAIYMSEYASRRVRAVAKPASVLAGIPASSTGCSRCDGRPLIRDWLAQPLGLGDSGASVATAGLVMGIMLIVRQLLSDDIINAVPQSLRDGALGLSSTVGNHSPRGDSAALRIVGAVLLAIRIGETMIVVLGASHSGSAATRSRR